MEQNININNKDNDVARFDQRVIQLIEILNNILAFDYVYIEVFENISYISA